MQTCNKNVILIIKMAIFVLKMAMQTCNKNVYG